MRTHPTAFLLVLTAVCGLKAQVPQPSPTLSPGASNTWNLDWEGVYGRGYFLQHSDDLVNWQYFPLMEMGWGSTIPYGFASSAERFFVRLRYTDDTANFWSGDYDGDGISNSDEIQIHGTDPFNADTDGDGVPDGAEIAADTDPNEDQSLPDFWWQRTTRDLQYDFDDYEPPYNTGTLVRNALWDATLNSTEQLSAPIPFPNLKGRLQELTFPSSLASTQGAGGLATSEGYSTLLPNPPCYHATLNHQRHWLRTGTAWPEQYKKTVIVLTERTIDGVEQTPVVETEDVIIPANQLVSEPFDLESGFVQNFTGNEYHSEQVTTTPLTVAIEPDDDQAGNTGDLIPSNKGAVGERHYISPKKTTEIPADYVVLKATEIAQDRFVELLEWEGGEAHPTDPMKRRVKRDAAAKTVVKIKVKQGGAEAAKINVWVVWWDITAQKVSGPTITRPIIAGQSWTRAEVSWHFEATVQPASILTLANDVPDMTGANVTQVPNAQAAHAFDGAPFGDATYKWDISRQWRERDLMPSVSPNDILWPATGALKGTLPTPDKIQSTSPNPGADHYPSDKVEGNDDLGNDIDVYAAGSGGKLLDDDPPRNTIRDGAGAVGDIAEARSHFQAFVRAEIGGKWYRCSDFSKWRFHTKFKKADEAVLNQDLNGDGDKTDKLWIDDGSVSDATNTGF